MTAELPLWERDPDAYREYEREGQRQHPRKLVNADLLVRDQQGQILLVDPSYKPTWELPGGVVQENESPRAAAQRKVRDEVGLDLTPTRLLVVDYVSRSEPWDDCLTLIFDGGTLTDAQLKAVRVRDPELAGFAFCDPSEAGERLPEAARPRLAAACEGLRFGVSRYLQDGEKLA
jgi:ADP-ribose pyrophosphatase YjhB (NUDIX family)